MADTLSAPARLLRGFAIDFLTAHNLAAVNWVMDPGYRLSIGGHVFDGRDAEYLPATGAQLEQFPGLCVTVHDVILGPQVAAMWFTEHGVSPRNAGRAAAWGGVTLFRIENGRLRFGWAEEDYFARKRQLKSGVCDAVRAPHQAPWDQACLPPSEATETVLRAWLADPAAVVDASVVDEISVEGPRFRDLVLPTAICVTELFSAGDRAAFHLACSGTYNGGFDDIDSSLLGRPVVLLMAGLVTVRDGWVGGAQIAADRLGLHRQLLNARST